jgi:hypothetical protein
MTLGFHDNKGKKPSWYIMGNLSKAETIDVNEFQLKQSMS